MMVDMKNDKGRTELIKDKDGLQDKKIKQQVF